MAPGVITVATEPARHHNDTVPRDPVPCSYKTFVSPGALHPRFRLSLVPSSFFHFLSLFLLVFCLVLSLVLSFSINRVSDARRLQEILIPQ